MANAILNQLKQWRARWRIDRPEEDILNREFAVAFTTPSGQAALDYLIDVYFKPIQFVGGVVSGSVVDPWEALAERNGQQFLLVDILTRVDKGLHPSKYEVERGSQDEREVDVRA